MGASGEHREPWLSNTAGERVAGRRDCMDLGLTLLGHKVEEMGVLGAK